MDVSIPETFMRLSFGWSAARSPAERASRLNGPADSPAAGAAF